ncbi:MAG: DUF342 domain-containing protein [Desulfitobacteriaceae bacterium]
MPEEIVRGRSLEEIRGEWAEKLGILSTALNLEVLEKPSLFTRQWKVKLSWDVETPGKEEENREPEVTRTIHAIWEESKYQIVCPEGMSQVIPFSGGGELFYSGSKQEVPFSVTGGDTLEFYPLTKQGQLTWQLEVRLQGISAVAKVMKRSPGRYVLPPQIEVGGILDLRNWLHWEEMPPSGEYWDEEHLATGLRELRVVYGRCTGAWAEILAAEDGDEVVVAEAMMPIVGQPSHLEEFVNAQETSEENGKSIDFFASKIRLVQEGTVLARKIPGVPGQPGKDVLGRVIPVQAWKDFQFRLKKNVRLSEDGLEVLASCPGRPVRFEEYTYGVDNVYVLNQNVDLATGSIEFPGDVQVNGNVQDGLRIVAGGKVEIRGTVSHAEIRAEKGLQIFRPILGGKIVVGEKYVVRSEILRRLRELLEELHPCLNQTDELVASPGAARLKPGQCLKLILEKNFPELPKKAAETEQYILAHQDEIVTQELMVSVRTAKHFLVGLGPLELHALPFLTRVAQALNALVESISLEVPENLKCVVEYVQGTTIESGGDFICSKGAYNSLIRAEGNVEIEGVCRGGKIMAGGNVTIRELGGSEVSSTFVEISGSKRLKVNYCHPNVVIAVNKEVIRIEEAYKSLEVYRERGRVEVEKLRAAPL